jgi:predicted amidohydrolase
MTREVTLAATQFATTWDIAANLDAAERLVREAAGRGAQIVLLQELFATPYFPITQDTRHFELAGPAEGHPVIARFTKLAAELEVVLPVSFFERAGQAFFNSIAVIDADGAFLGVYRKSHIPDSGGYYLQAYDTARWTGWTRVLGDGPAFFVSIPDSYLNLRPVATREEAVRSATWMWPVIAVGLAAAAVAVWSARRRRERPEEA